MVSLQKTVASQLRGLPPLHLNSLTTENLALYFQNSWELYERLFSSLKEEAYFQAPDPLRHPLIFYFSHTAAFYVNKLKISGALKTGINEHFEQIFAKGVDPVQAKELKKEKIKWPTIEAVQQYRVTVHQLLLEMIQNIDLRHDDSKKHPLWAFLMGIAHERIHFETSSVLIHQLPIEHLNHPTGWHYAPTEGGILTDNILEVSGRDIILGKKDFSKFGWDNEYGSIKVTVPDFLAAQNMVTNKQFHEFLSEGGYDNKNFWSKEGFLWKQQTNTKQPKFWVDCEGTFFYRALFDLLPLPEQWPVEINFYEAEAYSHWKGEGWRVMREPEYRCISEEATLSSDQLFSGEFANINLQYFSPSPVGLFSDGDPTLFNDVSGNLWEWIDTDFHALPGFKTHDFYPEFSTPYFDKHHIMMLGGSWATTGSSALPDYRLWFRRNFFQHAGFRIVRSV